MYQILDLLRANNIFCTKYNLEEGCTNSNNPYIVFKKELLIIIKLLFPNLIV